eukprot:COSAG02_NODE_2981_length_7624_cov_3.557475_6_plen_53_part_00
MLRTDASAGAEQEKLLPEEAKLYKQLARESGWLPANYGRPSKDRDAGAVQCE